jgi:3'-phosphoadenosine 5'-phosphosulfate sulfotransferase (PAPS reductase)/FAD synthetase
LDEKTAKVYSQLRSYKALVNKTSGFIRWALEQTKKPYVACSFGKDSSVMLHLILQHRSDIVVRFASHPETRLLDNYDTVISFWLERGINYEEIYCDGGLIKLKHHQRDSLNIGNWDSFFVGIRAEESFGRRVSLKNYGMFHKLANGRIKISPMAWWTEKDIAVYVLSKKIPCLDKYKKEGFSARTTSGIPRTHINECLLSLKNLNINNFNKLCKIFPDAREFV